MVLDPFNDFSYVSQTVSDRRGNVVPKAIALPSFHGLDWYACAVQIVIVFFFQTGLQFSARSDAMAARTAGDATIECQRTSASSSGRRWVVDYLFCSPFC